MRGLDINSKESTSIMIENKIKKSALLLVMLYCISCESSDHSDPDSWRVSEENENYDNLESITFEHCANKFTFGPVWNSINDKSSAMREDIWIASLTTSKWYIYGGNILPEAPVYVEEMETVKSILHQNDVSLLKNKDDETLVVKGKPADIINVIKDSCEILMFDLTGFNCECNPEQCEKAETCDINIRFLDQDKNDTYIHNERISPFLNRTYFGCDEDSVISQTGLSLSDYRGVYWEVSQVDSWNNSLCQ